MREVIAIIGLGLMGGSLAKRIKEKRPECMVIGYDPDRDVILAAIDGKVIDAGFMQMNQEIKRAHTIVIATPPLLFPQVLDQIKAYELSSQTVITDLISVKTCCEEWVQAAGLSAHYVGGHPLCGHDQSGFMYSHSQYFDQGPYCLMAAKDENREAYTKLKAFLESLGIQILSLKGDSHDELMAYVSHMPHALSYMMSNVALNKQRVITLGKSFKEMTRVSKSSPQLWTEIFILNQKPLLQALKEMKDEIVFLETLMENVDREGLYTYLNASQEERLRRDKEEICWSSGVKTSIV